MKYQMLRINKTLCMFLFFFALITCALLFQKYSLEIIQWINKLGWFAPVLFIITYALATVLLLPTMVLTLAGGAIFGPVIGTLLNLLGATAGAALAFLITRHLLFNWFEKRRGERINRIIAGVNEKGWLCVAVLRLFPIVPFNLVNYGMGITGIQFRLYLITTFIFLIPAEIIYTYFGFAGLNALSNPGQFYKSGGILLSVLGVVFLCLMQLFKPKQLNAPPKDDRKQNNDPQIPQPFESPEGSLK